MLDVYDYVDVNNRNLISLSTDLGLGFKTVFYEAIITLRRREGDNQPLTMVVAQTSY